MKNNSGPKRAGREISRLEFCSALATGGIALTGLISIAGCGGGSSSNGVNGGGTGRATFTVTWPAPSRLIPSASNSIVIALRKSIDQPPFTSQTLVRPADGGTTSASFENLPRGGVYVTADAYPNADGTGTSQASAFSNFTIIEAGKTATISLTLDSTIDHLEINPSTIPLIVGASIPLPITAKNRAGDIVLIDPAKLTYTYYYDLNDGRLDTTKIATVDSTGKLTAGTATGFAGINVTETESGRKAKATVIVSPPADKPITQKSVSFQIDATHSGRATFDQPLYFPNLHAWSAQATVTGTPVIADGRVFVIETKDGFPSALTAFERATGKRLWSKNTPFAGALQPYTLTYDKGTLIVGGGGPGPVAVAPPVVGIDPATGTIRWQFQTPALWSIRTMPVAVDGTVYFSFHTYPRGSSTFVFQQLALDSATGVQRWERSIPLPASTGGVNLLADVPTVSTEEGLVFFARNNALDALDITTGNLVWESSLPQQIRYRYTQVVHKGKLYTQGVTLANSYVTDPPILDTRTGAQIGTYRWYGNTPGICPAFSENICLQVRTGGLIAVDSTTQQTLWTATTESVVSPIFIDNTAFVVDRNGYINFVDGATGNVSTKQGFTGGSILAAGEGYLVVAGGSYLGAYHLAGPK